MSGLLIIGASQAGVQLAVSLRALGHEGPINYTPGTLIRPPRRFCGFATLSSTFPARYFAAPEIA